MKKYLPALPLIAFTPNASFAHCPLCTAGAGILAVFAASMGVSSVVVGMLIGALALALSFWLSGVVKKQYIPHQKPILIALIFLGTVIPIIPLVQDYGPLYVPFIGEYGTTYTINLYILGVIIGAFIMSITPLVSNLITKLRGKQLPFQGLTITIVILVAASVIIQFLS